MWKKDVTFWRVFIFPVEIKIIIEQFRLYNNEYDSCDCENREISSRTTNQISANINAKLSIKVCSSELQFINIFFTILGLKLEFPNYKWDLSKHEAEKSFVDLLTSYTVQCSYQFDKNCWTKLQFNLSI